MGGLYSGWLIDTAARLWYIGVKHYEKEKAMPYPYSLDDEIKEYKPTVLKTDRSMWKLMILDILTLHLYSIFFFIPFSFDIDKVDPKRDGSRTLNYLFAYVLSLFTFAIVLHIWHY